MIDPSHLAFNSSPPPVHIEDVLDDGKVVSLQSGLRLPPRLHRLQFDYTALSFVAPEKVRFRYRLEGHDNDWHDAGSSRQALYNDLPPATYKFHVIAANNDGVWNETGDSFSFTILPAFYQTDWFLASMIVLATLLLWILVRLRIRSATQQVEARMHERLAERDRIARELHDTLIQGVQGLILRMHVVSQDISGNEQPKREMETVLDHAEDLLVEGRNRVRDLRSQERGDKDIVSMIEQLVNSLQDLKGPLIEFKVVGMPRPLSVVIQEEVTLFAREALSNAVRHSQGTHISCGLCYEANGLSFDCQDNGVGLNDVVLESKRKEGHWGLLGMRERAETIGAVFTVESSAAGVRVRLRISSRVAFAKNSTHMPSLASLRSLWRERR
jgi:signal transduction histidine kinase